jgi:hypothetical protein
MNLPVVSHVEGTIRNSQIRSEVVTVGILLVTFEKSQSSFPISLLYEDLGVEGFFHFILQQKV